ncbi:hypothetical protein EI555_013317, partial [Monodon monoceros]
DFYLQRILWRNHDISKVWGTWYSISMAADDMRRIEEDGDLRVFMQSIESLENGGLQFSLHLMLHNGCVDVAMVCDKTGKSGEYTITCKVCALGLWGMRALVSEANYLQYVTAELQERDGDARRVWTGPRCLRRPTGHPPRCPLPTPSQMAGRFPELKPSFLDRFEKICKSHGLGPENIVDPSNTGGPHCLPASSLGKREAPGASPQPGLSGSPGPGAGRGPPRDPV